MSRSFPSVDDTTQRFDTPVESALAGTLASSDSPMQTALYGQAVSVRARATPEYFLGDVRWDGGRYTSEAIELILADAVKGQGVPTVTIRQGNSPQPIVMSRTLEVYRTGLHLIGLGVGNPSDYGTYGGDGTTLRWAGPTGVPMIKIRDSRNVHISDIHFQGSTASPPSAGLNLNCVSGDAQGTNSYFTVERCLFGYFPWLPTTAAGWQMDYGMLVDGANVNNDQFYVKDTQFSRATVAQVKLVNSQSIQGSFENCMFDGNYTAKGMDTAAAVTLYNPQFGQCTTDLEIAGSARVTDLSHHSENSGRIATLTGNAARLVMHGGYVALNSTRMTTAFDVTSLGGGGLLGLHGTAFYQAATGTRPNVKVRGSSSVATVGELSVVGVTGLEPADFDIKGGTGTNRKMRVFIQAGEMSVNRLVTGVTDEVVPVVAMT